MNEYEQEILQRFGGVRLGDDEPRYARRGLSPKEFDYSAFNILGVPENRKLNTWDYMARPEQLVPQWDWRYFHIDAGRGWGKSRAANEWLVGRATEERGSYAVVGNVSYTPYEVQQVLENRLLNGELTGYEWINNRRSFKLPNGSFIHVLSKSPDEVRGHNLSAAVIDLNSADIGLYRDRGFWEAIVMATRVGRAQIFMQGTDKTVPGWIRNSGGYVLRSWR